MTTGEIIRKVDELRPNTYTDQMKIGWLSELDGKIHAEIICTHTDKKEDDETPWNNPLDIENGAKEPENNVQPFTTYSTLNDELLIPFPYGGDVYVFYLMSQIDFYNAEIAKYNQSITLYNNAYQAYANWYNRTHSPIRRSRRFLF